MLKTRVLVPIVFSLLAVTACGSGDATSSNSASSPDTEMSTDQADVADTPGARSVVDLRDSRFDPRDIEISAGDTVAFTNNDPYAHTVTSVADSATEFDSGEIGQDVTFEQSFDAAGTYAFYCQIHPTMRGTITVS